MEREPKEVVWSNEFDLDIQDIYLYGEETFGPIVADRYVRKIFNFVYQLKEWYLIHSECRYLPTKSKKYRNIITNSHIIIYRISDRIEVLRIFHSSVSINKIISCKRIKL